MEIAFCLWIMSTLFSIWAGAQIGPDYLRLRRFMGSTYYNGPVWEWFGLSCVAYLVMPRSLMCGMPLAWQESMVKLLKEYNEVYDWKCIDDNYTVQVRGLKGRFYTDAFAKYLHPPALPYKERK